MTRIPVQAAGRARPVDRGEFSGHCAMTPIEEWLGSLGLSEYADRFAENRIDLSILQDLTDQDLKDIGVVLGDRRRILRAIAELTGTISATPQLAAAPESKPRDARSRCCSRTLLVRPHSPLGWISKTYENSSRPIINASLKLCAVSAASWRSIWATACLSILATPRLMRMTQSGRCVPGWS